MSRKKVLLLVTLSETGGAQKVVYHLATGLDREKFDVTVGCAPGGELVDWLKKAPGVKVIELGRLKRDISPLQDILCLLQLYCLIKSGGYDIVHCHSSKAGIVGRLAAYLAGTPKIFFTVHGWGIDERQPFPLCRMYILAERLAGLVSTRVVCVSEYDRKKGMALKLVDAAKMAVINNGVPDEAAPDKVNGTTVREELDLSAGNIVIGTVMRLAPPKQPLFFLEAAKKLLEKDNSGCRFIIIGDGPLRSPCEEYIAGNNLGGKVLLTGTREDVPRLLSVFDIFTLFSSHEGLPLTIIEAMLAGVPVVANAVGGVGELVIHQKTGYLINNLNVSEAEKALWDLISDYDKRISMGEAGRRRALDLFSIDKMVNQYKDLYLS
ncbi:MAG: glycosyltransferase family 4 protein [Bacillota bacterium]